MYKHTHTHMHILSNQTATTRKLSSAANKNNGIIKYSVLKRQPQNKAPAAAHALTCT